MTRRRREKAQSELIRSALIGMAARLTPQRQIENPVMFLVWLASVVVTGRRVCGLYGTDGLRSLGNGFDCRVF